MVWEEQARVPVVDRVQNDPPFLGFESQIIERVNSIKEQRHDKKHF